MDRKRYAPNVDIVKGIFFPYVLNSDLPRKDWNFML